MRMVGVALLGVLGLLVAACGSATQSRRGSRAPPPRLRTSAAADGRRHNGTRTAAQREQQSAAAQPQEQQPAEAAQQQAEQERAQATATDAADEQAADDEALVTYLPRDATHTDEGIPIIRDNYTPSDIGRLFTTHWGIRIVDVDDLRMGAPRDAIPAIFGPLYLTIDEANDVYEPEIPVVQVRLGDDARAFPLGILIWHEIVNDTINGQPVAITFCPLCNTAIAFHRQLGAQTLDFAVSGLLRNSDLVMYDRNTETLWQQATGRAIIGSLVGARLEGVPATIVSFAQFREAFPDGLVMSRDTGWGRAYGQNPYVRYDTPEGRPFLYNGQLDDRLPPKSRVVSVETPGGAEIAYPWTFVTEQRVVYDTHDATRIVILWTPGTNSALGAGIIKNAADVGSTAIFDRELDGRLLSFAPNADDASGQTFVDNETGSVWDIFGRAVEGELAAQSYARHLLRPLLVRLVGVPPRHPNRHRIRARVTPSRGGRGSPAGPALVPVHPALPPL